MSRRKTLHSYEYPYHITARSNNKEWFYLDKSLCWSIFCEKLNLASEMFQFQILAFVLMSNHYHLILKIIPEHKLGSIMNWLQTSISREINKKAGRINHIFGGPYKSSLITKTIYYAHVLKYVYRNPVRAGMCENVQTYPYSTLNSKDIKLNLNDSLNISNLLPKEECDYLNWLNTPLEKDYDEIIRKGLKKSKMKLVDSIRRKNHILEDSIF